ncbi:MAG: VWA domain-containing protein, partial [Gemmataceae bacterium]
MNPLGEQLGTHWVATILLVGAAAIVLQAFLKNRLRLGAFALLPAAYSLGGFFLTGTTYETFGPLWSVGGTLLILSAFQFTILALVLFSAKRWSPTFAWGPPILALAGLGSLTERELSSGLVEVYRSVRGLEFVRPWWLVLLVFVPVVVLLARRSLGGLGPVRKWGAIAVRAAIVALLAMALAEPRLRRPSDNVTVLYVIDRSMSIPQDVDLSLPPSEQVDRRWERVRKFVDDSVKNLSPDHRQDQSGVILFGKRPRLALPPSPVSKLLVDPQMAGPIDGQYTDIAAALKLALASFPEGHGKRVVLVSDGNQNLGNAEEQAALAKQNGVQIDTIALAPGYRNESEVLVQSVEAPRTTAAGQRLPVRVLVRNASPTRSVDGILEVVRIGLDDANLERIEQVAIDSDSPQVLLPLDPGKPARVRLNPGLNMFRFRDKPSIGGESSFSYRATFSPIRSGIVVKSDDPALSNESRGLPGDRIANNRATTAIVSRGQQRVLFIDDSRGATNGHQHLINTLVRRKIRVDAVNAAKLPVEKNDFALFLTNFDLIVMANAPAESFTGDQMEAIRSAVHDQGCGLIMIGGPDAFGPGGYQGTPVEAALPVDCEIKAMKAAGKGGLILIMHASEMAEGNKWQIDIAKLALNRLTPNDMVGIMQYGLGLQNV